MKKLGEILLQEGPFSELVIGNTAVARGMSEAGVRVATSYPGSPTPEIAAAILSIPAESRPFYFEFSVNEKVATEVACGASLNGHLSCVFFKSVGLNVAADSLVQLGLMELAGGMVVVLGDDPGANSSQNEQDNRHFARMAGLPVLEPADPPGSLPVFPGGRGPGEGPADGGDPAAHHPRLPCEGACPLRPMEALETGRHAPVRSGTRAVRSHHLVRLSAEAEGPGKAARSSASGPTVPN